MTLQEFDTYINIYLQQDEKERTLTKALEALSEDNNIFLHIAPKLKSAYIEMLEKYFNDANETISWWIYEWNCGTNEVEIDGKINYGYFIHDVPVPMSNTYDLFNYLMWNKNKNKDDEWDGTYKFDEVK